MSIKENFEKILKDVENYNPKIVAVTKYYDISKMIEAYDAGLRDFGESRAQEAVQKINKMDDKTKTDSSYHFIGHLQTNKVKYVVGNFEYIHTVDSLKLAQCIDEEAKSKGIVQKVLIQVNNANEPQKFGVTLEEFDNLIAQVQKLNSIQLEGLMNIAPLNCEEKKLEELFEQMRELKEKYNLKELSMGMSNDYKIAIKHGATIIRLGRILFE